MNTSLQLTMGIDAPHRNQYLFSDHYLNHLLPADPRWAEAWAEAEAFLAWLRERYAREQAHLPTLVIGDSNDWRNTLGKTVFAAEEFVHLTAPVSRFRSFPAYLAMGSLDKAWARGDVTVRHAQVIRSKPARVASDHLPLVIDFHLNGAAPSE